MNARAKATSHHIGRRTALSLGMPPRGKRGDESAPTRAGDAPDVRGVDAYWNRAMRSHPRVGSTGGLKRVQARAARCGANDLPPSKYQQAPKKFSFFCTPWSKLMYILKDRARMELKHELEVCLSRRVRATLSRPS